MSVSCLAPLLLSAGNKSEGVNRVTQMLQDIFNCVKDLSAAVAKSNSNKARAPLRKSCPSCRGILTSFFATTLLGVVAGRAAHAFADHHSYHQCYHPLDFWFWIACFIVVGFGVAFSIGRSAGNGNWWFIDPKSWIAKAAFTCTWAVLLPFFLGWTALGMSWLSDTLDNTPDCFPSDGYFARPLFFALLQVVCAMVTVVYAVFVANVWDAERCRRANAVAISVVEDDDLVERWGKMKPAASMELCGGLLASEFGSLPRHVTSSNGSPCVICLGDTLKGECCRSLPACGHTFHRACIDLWLLRSTSCPLCNTDVRCSENQDGSD